MRKAKQLIFDITSLALICISTSNPLALECAWTIVGLAVIYGVSCHNRIMKIFPTATAL